MTRERESRPDRADRAASDLAITASEHTALGDMIANTGAESEHAEHVKLVRRAERALRLALAEGVFGPEVEALQDWLVPARVELRRQRARTGVATVLAAIKARGGDGP